MSETTIDRAVRLYLEGWSLERVSWIVSRQVSPSRLRDELIGRGHKLRPKSHRGWRPQKTRRGPL